MRTKIPGLDSQLDTDIRKAIEGHLASTKEAAFKDLFEGFVDILNVHALEELIKNAEAKKLLTADYTKRLVRSVVDGVSYEAAFMASDWEARLRQKDAATVALIRKLLANVDPEVCEHALLDIKESGDYLNSAVRGMALKTARFLLENGANPDLGYSRVYDCLYQPALPVYIATKNKDIEMIKLLGEFGASFDQPYIEAPMNPQKQEMKQWNSTLEVAESLKFNEGVNLIRGFLAKAPVKITTSSWQHPPPGYR